MDSDQEDGYRWSCDDVDDLWTAKSVPSSMDWMEMDKEHDKGLLKHTDSDDLFDFLDGEYLSMHEAEIEYDCAAIEYKVTRKFF